MEASPSPCHPDRSEAERRDLQFRGPFLELFFDRAYPDFLLHCIGYDHRMKLTSATNLNRKSQRSVVERSAFFSAL
jgi:hypothetical protein